MCQPPGNIPIQDTWISICFFTVMREQQTWMQHNMMKSEGVVSAVCDATCIQLRQNRTEKIYIKTEFLLSMLTEGIPTLQGGVAFWDA